MFDYGLGMYLHLIAFELVSSKYYSWTSFILKVQQFTFAILSSDHTVKAVFVDTRKRMNKCPSARPPWFCSKIEKYVGDKGV